MIGEVYLLFLEKMNVKFPETIRLYGTSKNLKIIKLKSFEEFKESPPIKELFGNNKQKISKAYKDYCLNKTNRLKKLTYGGNPINML